MEKWYPLHMGSDTVGKVQVTRQGLYYAIHCRCHVGRDVMCRLMAYCSGKREDLGVVVPMDGGFGLDTKIPVKRLGEEPAAFVLTPKHTPLDVQIIPVYPDEPFDYLARLKDAYLAKRDGQTCICMK